MKKREILYAKFVRTVTTVAEGMAQLLIWRGKRDLTAERNIRYSSDSKKCRADFYYKDKSALKPVMLYIHGGGFICGSKELRKYYCYDFADEGYFVMNIDYDLAPEKVFPVQFQQMFKALEFLYSKKEEYNLDLSGIFLAGESAGAYFCAIVGALSRGKASYSDFGVENFLYKDELRIKAMILLNGAYDAVSLSHIKFLNMETFLKSFFDINYDDLKAGKLDKEVEKKSPFYYIDSDFPPCVIGRGESDGLDKQSQMFISLLDKYSVDYTSFLATGIVGIHGFCLASNVPEGKRCRIVAQCFLQRFLK